MSKVNRKDLNEKLIANRTFAPIYREIPFKVSSATTGSGFIEK